MRKSKRFFARFAAWVLAVILAAGVMPMYLSARPSVPPSVPRGRISGDLFTASGQTRTLQVTIPIERLIGTGSGHMYNITIATDYASGSIVHPQFDYITSAGGVSSDATVRIDATISGAERMDLRIQYSPDDISGFTSIPSNATGYFTFEIDVMSYDGDEWVDSWLLIWVGGALASGYGNLLISQSLAIPCAECNTRPCICNDSSNGNCPDCDAYPCICEPSAVAITTTALPNGVVSQAYSANIFATGVSPITWAVSGGSLPPGLNLSVSDTHEGSVTVSGTPTQVGTFPFTLTATSANGTTDSREFSITISDGALLRFTFSSVPPFMSVPFENPFHFAINAQLAAREHSAGSTPNFYSVRYEWLRNGVVWWGAGGSGVIPASRFAQGYSVAINLFLPGGLSHHDRGGVWQLRLTALNANGGSVFTDVSGSMFLTVHAQTWHEPWHPYVPEPTPPPRVSPPRAPVTPLFNIDDAPPPVPVGISDAYTAVAAVSDFLEIATEQQRQSGIVELFAERAIMYAATQHFGNEGVTLDASSVAHLRNVALGAQSNMQAMFAEHGHQPNRDLRTVVGFTTSETQNVHVRVAGAAAVDYIFVRTPDVEYSLSQSFLAGNSGLDIRISSGTVSRTPRYDELIPWINAPGLGTPREENMQRPDVLPLNILGAQAGLLVTAQRPNAPRSYTIDFSRTPTEPVRVAVPQSVNYPNLRDISTGENIGGRVNPVSQNFEANIRRSGTYVIVENRVDFADIQHLSSEVQRSIRWLASQGIIGGMSQTHFSPEQSLSRAQTASLFTRVLDIYDANADGGFNDVARGSWFFGAAGSASRHGLMTGTGTATFSPNDTISKVQLTAVSARVLQNRMGYRAPADVDGRLQANFSDHDLLPGWSRSEIALAQRENMVIPRVDGSFAPNESMTRGDAALILYRLHLRLI